MLINNYMLIRSQGHLNRSEQHKSRSINIYMIESVHSVCTYLVIRSLDHKVSSCMCVR